LLFRSIFLFVIPQHFLSFRSAAEESAFCCCFLLLLVLFSFNDNARVPHPSLFSSVKFRDMVYRTSLDILYRTSFTLFSSDGWDANRPNRELLPLRLLPK